MSFVISPSNAAATSARRGGSRFASTSLRWPAVAGRILVLQHAPHSGLGAYGDVLAERGDETTWLRLHDGDFVPERVAGFDGVISLGAAISVYDGDAPWLVPELTFLRAAVAADLPVWGICFGAQMLAAAIGGRVWRGTCPEVGIRTLAMTPAASDDPVFGSLGPMAPMFHWHGDSFDLPSRAVHLAGSAEYPNQAFRVGAHAYGVQFHAEATLELVRSWIDYPATAAQLEASNCPGATERLYDEVSGALPEVNEVARRLIGAWRAAADPSVAG